jgi:hypothetical protein
MPLPTLYPLNDWAVKATLKDLDTVTGETGPLLTGAVAAFISLSSAASATVAHANLNCSVTHIGDGVWLFFLDASLLTLAILDPLFSGATPYLIVEFPSGFRTANALTYSESRLATVT